MRGHDFREGQVRAGGAFGFDNFDLKYPYSLLSQPNPRFQLTEVTMANPDRSSFFGRDDNPFGGGEQDAKDRNQERVMPARKEAIGVIDYVSTESLQFSHGAVLPVVVPFMPRLDG